MKKKIYNIFEKVMIIITVFMVLMSSIAPTTSNAATSKTKIESGFYYSGTAEGTYVVTDGFGSWLIEFLKQILDFLLGLLTMGGRMVFVGWAALIEELVTWFLEASSGIPMEINSDNAKTQNVAVDSGNNVTLEAIVYNQVPILDVNLFNNSTISCVSGTGNFIVVCEDCYEQQKAEEEAKKPQKNEAPNLSSNPYAGQHQNMYAPKPVAPKERKVCKSKDCSCTKCWQSLADAGYLETDSNGKYILNPATGKPIRKGNAVTLIKEAVSKWYYIIRLIAIAGLLIVLLAIGIKMGISTIASEKALYKRMLVDWVVGMIILFMIHYYMIGVIFLNETLVGFIKETSSVSDMVKKEYSVSDKEDSEFEIGLYQATRTRAYDPKLINGTSGTVLYITLVFLTIKFVIMYLKRYLNVIILTVIAPGIAFSYAIQKVFYGKSKAFSKWMYEYFITVFIQTIHALIYTVFLSTALKIALDSISGTILAFVFINFFSKADGVFKKIFKLSGDSTSDMDKAPSDLKNLQNEVRSATNMLTAGGILKNSPITKAATAPLRAIGTGAVMGASLLKGRLDDKKVKSGERQKEIDEETGEFESIGSGLEEIRKNAGLSGGGNKEFAAFMKKHEDSHDYVGTDERNAIGKELEELENLASEGKLSPEDTEKLQGLRQRYDKATEITFGKSMKAVLNNALDRNNYFVYDAEKGKYKAKYGIFGSRKYDRTKHEYVTNSMSKLVQEQFKLENLLMMDDKDKKLFGDIKNLYKQTFIGMGSLFLGLGTVVTNPGVGMGLLTVGATNMTRFADKSGFMDVNACYRCPTAKGNRRYTFNRFGKGAQRNISKNMRAKANDEKNHMVVENVRKRHGRLYKALCLGGDGLLVSGALAVAGAPVVGVGLVTAGAIMRVSGSGMQRYSAYSPNSIFGQINKNYFDKMEKAEKECIQDEIRLSAECEKVEMEDRYAFLTEMIEKDKMEDSETTDDASEAVRRNEAVELENGEVIQFNRTKVDGETDLDKNGLIKDDVALKVIDEAVARILVDKVLNSESLESINIDSIQNDARKEIIKALIAQGLISKEDDIDGLIKDLDTKIQKSAQGVINGEMRGKGTSNDSEELTPFDEAIIESVVREKVESGEIKKSGDLSHTMIVEAVAEKRAEIIGRQSSDDVIQSMQQFGGKDKPEPGKLFGDTTKTSGRKQETVGDTSKPGDKKQESFEDVARMSDKKQESVRRGVTEMKKKSAPKAKTEAERRAEKARRIAALDDVLMAAARGETTVTDSSNDQIYKSVDEVIEELFQNTAGREEAYALLGNVEAMRRLNVRGEKAKMNSSGKAYNQAKRDEKKRKAFEQYPDLAPTGDRAYTNGDGRQELSKEIYGPVTDIVSTIKGISSSRK